MDLNTKIEILSRCVQEVIDDPSKKINDSTNLFEVGMHSLSIISLINKINKYDLDIPLIDVFRHPIIGKLANEVHKLNESESNTLNVYFSLDEYTKSEIVDILEALSELYSSIGGDELVIKRVGQYQIEGILEPVN